MFFTLQSIRFAAMNKEQLKSKYSELTLYDISNIEEKRKWQSVLNYHQKKEQSTDHIKLIAPFGAGHKADFYYFEHENTPISEQILRDMGIIEGNITFGNNHIFVGWLGLWKVILNGTTLNVKNANQLHQLIQLLK